VKLVSLELRNFKPFRNLTLPDGDGELPGGLIIIRGANSTGKSSLLEAILWALWGPTAVGLNNEELISFASSFCSVGLEFDVAGSRYKVKRTYDPADGMKVLLSKLESESWKRIADKSQSVGRALEGILNLEPSQALNTLLVRQGEVGVIAAATPTVLRDLLVKVYNIDLLGQMTKQLESLEGDLTSQTKALEDEFRPPEMIREQIEDAKSRIKEEQDDLEETKNERTRAQELLKSLPMPKTLKTVRDLIEELDRTEHENSQNIKLRDRELKAAGLGDSSPKITRARVASLNKESQRLEKERGAAEAKQSEINVEIGKSKGMIQDLEEKIEQLHIPADSEEGVGIVCPTCQRPLSDEESKDLVAEYRNALEEHGLRIEELEKQKESIPRQLREKEERLRVIPKLIDATERVVEQEREVKRSASQAEKIARRLGQALSRMEVETIQKLLEKHDASSVDDLQNTILKIQETLNHLKTRQESAGRRIKNERQTVKELKGKEAEMKELGARIETMKELKNHATYVRRKLVSGFIADYVFQKRLIGIIRKATNQYVSSFTNAQYTSIDLEPTPAKGRSGAGLVLKVWDERDKANKKTSQLSFGDRTAISLGLRLGISRTMSSIRPIRDSPSISPRMRCVLLDEPLGGLDKGRRTSVVRNLVNDESFEQIFLITHTDVQGWEGVPVIEVNKSGATSTAVLSE